MKKITTLFVILSSSYLSATTSTVSHRTITTEPLLYSMIDYSKKQLSIEASPFFLSMYDTQHTNQNLMLNGKSTLKLDQQGSGDINPTWLNLISNNNLANYASTITLTPELSLGGMLLHIYKEYKTYYFDMRTAILKCSTQIKIEESGGKNGAISGINNALQAFTQDDWNYGKIGNSNEITGLDDIQFKLGGKYKTTTNAFDVFITGFGIVQAPTGSGTKSEWLLEPQVGTNHWALGGGFETMIHAQSNLNFLIGGDYRYFLSAWETRSFDLINNGQWSRYLGIQNTYGLPLAPSTNPLPGINYLTQLTEIEGRNQINLYTRLEKTISHCAFELSYNFFYKQEESIGLINNINTNYGIYTLTGEAGGGGGVATSSHANIQQNVTLVDENPVILTTTMFDKSSAQAQSFTSNSLMARIQRTQDNYNYGIGTNLEVAQSAGAISSWAVWAKFEYLFSSTSDRSITSSNKPVSLSDYSDISKPSPVSNHTQSMPTAMKNNNEYTISNVEDHDEVTISALQNNSLQDNLHEDNDSYYEDVTIELSDDSYIMDVMYDDELDQSFFYEEINKNENENSLLGQPIMQITDDEEVNTESKITKDSIERIILDNNVNVTINNSIIDNENNEAENYDDEDNLFVIEELLTHRIIHDNDNIIEPIESFEDCLTSDTDFTILADK